jgi:hypothetical protein
VNGRPRATQIKDVTGMLVIPMTAGENDVRIYFRRTIDRVIGDGVSLISLVLLVFAWMKTRRKGLQPPNPASRAV